MLQFLVATGFYLNMSMLLVLGQVPLLREAGAISGSASNTMTA
jgi:hypothetical protein